MLCRSVIILLTTKHFIVDRFGRSLDQLVCWTGSEWCSCFLVDTFIYLTSGLSYARHSPIDQCTRTRVSYVYHACVRELVDVARGCYTSYCLRSHIRNLCKYVCCQRCRRRRGLLRNLVHVFPKQSRVSTTSDARHAGEARDLGNRPNTNESVLRLPHTT